MFGIAQCSSSRYPVPRDRHARVFTLFFLGGGISRSQNTNVHGSAPLLESREHIDIQRHIICCNPVRRLEPTGDNPRSYFPVPTHYHHKHTGVKSGHARS